MKALENVVAAPISHRQRARVQAPRGPLVGSSESNAGLLSGHKVATKQILAFLLLLQSFPRVPIKMKEIIKVSVVTCFGYRH